MNVQVEDTGPCRKTLSIEVGQETVNKTYDELLGAFARNARVPGFRPGKAPRQIVQKRFAKEVLEEVKDRLMPQAYRDALAEKGLRPVAVLDVEDVALEPGASLRFKVVVDVMPEFDLPAYKGLPLTSEQKEVTDADVQEALDGLRDQRANYEDVEGRAVETGDLARIDFTATCEGRPLEEVAPGATGLGQGEDFWIQADESAFLPELGTALAGLSAGEQKDVTVTFPGDFQEADLAGKEAVFAVTMKGLREKKLPELDEAFLKTFGVESEEALREQIRGDIERMRGNAEERRRKDELIKQLLAQTELDVPETVVNDETRQAIYGIVRENTYRGVPKEAIEENRDQIFQAASQSAVERVKSRYVLLKIAEQESIEPPEEAVQRRLEALAMRSGGSVEDLRQDFEKRGQIDALREDVRMEKTLDFLLENAEIPA